MPSPTSFQPTSLLPSFPLPLHSNTSSVKVDSIINCQVYCPASQQIKNWGRGLRATERNDRSAGEHTLHSDWSFDHLHCFRSQGPVQCKFRPGFSEKTIANFKVESLERVILVVQKRRHVITSVFVIYVFFFLTLLRHSANYLSVPFPSTFFTFPVTLTAYWSFPSELSDCLATLTSQIRMVLRLRSKAPRRRIREDISSANLRVDE